VTLEERHSGRLEIPKCLNRKGQDAAPRAFGTNSPAAKGRNYRVENISMAPVPVDMENGLELPTTVSVHHRTAMNRHGETALSVHESSDPVGIEHKS